MGNNTNMPKGKPENTTKKCCVCGTNFVPVNNHQKYCSKKCSRFVYKTQGGGTTEGQYEKISGNWNRYFVRLCARSFNRGGLSPSTLIKILEKQNGKCALSGVELTCVLQKGIISKTNASIDRIDPKGEYTLENIQLVCAVINKFRIDTPLEEFKEWCRKVAEYAVHKKP